MADLAATSRRTKEDGDFKPLVTDLSVTTVHGMDPNIEGDTFHLTFFNFQIQIYNSKMTF